MTKRNHKYDVFLTFNELHKVSDDENSKFNSIIVVSCISTFGGI